MTAMQREKPVGFVGLFLVCANKRTFDWAVTAGPSGVRTLQATERPLRPLAGGADMWQGSFCADDRPSVPADRTLGLAQCLMFLYALLDKSLWRTSRWAEFTHFLFAAHLA